MEWFVAGSSVFTGMTRSLFSGCKFERHGKILVVVTDPSGDSDQQTVSATVVNTNPTIDVLTLNPKELTLNDTLSCYAESSDVHENNSEFLSSIRIPVPPYTNNHQYKHRCTRYLFYRCGL